MNTNQNNSLSLLIAPQSLPNVSGAYIAPDIEIIDIEIQMTILAGSGGVDPNDPILG